MSDHAPSGWYPDPAGGPGARWWDGSAWTDAVGPYPPARPRLPDGLSTSTAFVWILALSPVIGIVSDFFYDPMPRFGTPHGLGGGDVHVQIIELSSVYTPAYFVVQLIGLAVYAGSVVLAFLDERALARRGVVRPFAWPWAFLANAVYVIGRFVVLRKVAPRTSLLPLWVFCVLLAAGIVVGVVRVATALTHIPL